VARAVTASAAAGAGSGVVGEPPACGCCALGQERDHDRRRHGDYRWGPITLPTMFRNAGSERPLAKATTTWVGQA
jgi:hypothetical protein